MTDKTDIQNPEVNSETDKLVKADFSEYQRLMDAKMSGESVDSDTPPKKGGETATPPAKGESDTAASPENDDDNVGANDGKEGAEDSRGDLPKGVKRRLERAKRKADRAREEAEEWKRKYEEATRAAPKSSEDTPKQTGADSETPIPEEDYDFDYPEEADYFQSEQDTAGVNAWMEDVRRWDDNLPLKGPPKKGAEGTKTDPAPAPKREGDDPPPVAEGPANEQERVNQLFDDLREALEEDGTDDDLAEDFFDMLRSNRVRLSPQMLEWLADSDDSAKIAAGFVKSPRQANRIYRSPPGKHAAMLDSLVKRLGKAGDSGDGGTNAPVVKKMSGQRTRTAESILTDEKIDFGQWEKTRAQLDRVAL